MRARGRVVGQVVVLRRGDRGAFAPAELRVVQAVADVMDGIVGSMRNARRSAEIGWPPWALAHDDALDLWRTKLGLKVVDERITISHDPADPELGILSEPWMQPITWIDRGVLTTLPYDRMYGIEKLNEEGGRRALTGYRMSGGETSVEEMIRTTKRGLLVTRFSNIKTLDAQSLLATGLTRD